MNCLLKLEEQYIKIISILLMASLKMASFMGSLDGFTKTTNIVTAYQCITSLLGYLIMVRNMESLAIMIMIIYLVLNVSF